jgi:hypothetical protein
MTQRIPENFSAAEWRPVTIMGNTMRPRDPNDVQALSCGRGQSFGHRKKMSSGCDLDHKESGASSLLFRP